MPHVVIPVLDEAAALPALLSAMPPGYTAVVADNGSTDGSGDIARRAGAIVVDVPVRGFGAACWAGLTAAEPADGVVCFMDGDGSLDPVDLLQVAGPVLQGDSDLVLGARRPTTAGAWPVHARIANRYLALEIRRRTGQKLCDIGPMRAARRDDLLGSASRTADSAGRWRWSSGPPPPAGASTSCPSPTLPGPAGPRSPAPSPGRCGRYGT